MKAKSNYGWDGIQMEVEMWRQQVQTEIIAQSAVIFFVLFLLVYLLPDARFKRQAGPLLTAFTVTRLIVKFGIVIPEKEARLLGKKRDSLGVCL